MLFCQNNLYSDIDSAAGLDVSEGGAVEVDQECPLSALVWNKGQLDTQPGVWLHIWKTAG